MADNSGKDFSNLIDQLVSDSEKKKSAPTPPTSQPQEQNSEYLQYLKSIDSSLQKMLQTQGSRMSQSDVRNNMHSRSDFKNVSRRKSGNKFSKSSGFDSTSFIDGFEEALLEGFLGAGFRDKIGKAANAFADMLGVDLKSIPGTMGKELGGLALSAFKGTNFGKMVTSELGTLKNNLFGKVKGNFMKGVAGYDQKHGSNFAPEFEKIFNIFESKDDASSKVAAAKQAASQQLDRSSSEEVTGTDYSDNIVQVLDNILATTQSIDKFLYSDSKGRKQLKDDRKESDAKKAEEAKQAQEAKQGTDAANQAATDEQTKQLTQDMDNEVKSGSAAKDMPETEIEGNLKDQAKDQVQSKFGDKFKEYAQQGIGKAAGKLGDIGAKLSGKGGIVGKIGGLASKGSTWLSGLAGSGGAAAGAGSAAAGTAAAGTAAGTAAAGAGTAAAGAGTAAAGTATAGASAGGAALAGAGSGLAALGPYALIAVAALVVLTKTIQAFGPAVEGAKKMIEAAKKAGDRYNASRKENLRLETDRMKADINAMIEKPFKILEDAAQNVYDAWDKNVRLINGTQGYSKTDLQNLMAQYAARLRAEGLTDVIGGTDITEGLAKVLEAGLSGQVANEFAYLATKLNAAVPTEDFFGYAGTYASIAANAIKNGESEAAAIQYANKQLEQFASNLLYSSRQLAGGFSTGLKDAQSLFDESVKIAQAARTNNSAQISGVITSVSAIVGAVAPDLASSLVDSVVKAATGGNSSEIVALRSLAGINASNTEFLQQLAHDPQGVFEQLFRNLAARQNMSEANYMEVAEGLSEIFGLSMDTFARVDFNYLASAVSEMNVNNASLHENMALLASGQTTANAEQQKIAEINRYMIEEGLAYVLDNEVARSVQQHMWDEQLAREMMEAQYGVELKGAGLEFLEGIRSTVNNLLNILNPIAWVNKIVNVVNTATESAALEADLRQIIELGKVGNGNAQSLYNLTTRGQDLNLTRSYVSMMGGISQYEIAKANTQISNMLANPHMALTDINDQIISGSLATLQTALTSSIFKIGVDSAYKWGTVGKSTARLLGGSGVPSGTAITSILTGMSSTQAAQSRLNENLEKMISSEYIKEMAASGKTFEDWKDSASKFGITDIDKALTDAGLSSKQIEQQFQSAYTEAGKEVEAQRKEREETFWKNMQDYALIVHSKQDEIIALITKSNEEYLSPLNSNFKTYLDEWKAYFIEHEVYNKSYKFDDVERIRGEENRTNSDAIYTLAEALTGADLRDPQVQTNALLSQILLVINAIMQQNNKTSAGLSLPDTFSALALGMFNTGG